MTTINSKEQQAFVNCRSANAIWTKLAAQHMQNASASTHVLQATFFHYQYVASHNLMQHITAIEGMAQQLEDLGQPMNQSQIMTKIVSTLPPTYRNFMTVWDNLGPTEKTMPQLITKLMNEQHRNVNPNENLATSKQAEAFVSQSRTKPRYNERVRERHDNKRPRHECTYCGKSNHDQSTCRRRLNAEAGIAEEKCSYCHNYGHLLPACRKKAADDHTENKIKSSKAALSQTREEFGMAADTNSLDIHGWYADSGATHHMCGDKSMMHNYTNISSKSWSVNGIGAIKLYAHGKGDVSITTTLNGKEQTGTLNNVLYVPGLGTNLLSIVSATDRGIEVEFSNQTVLFKRNGVPIMSGNRNGKTLYKLNINSTKTPTLDNSTALPASVNKVSLNTWHQRLSHTNFNTIIKMARTGVVDGIDLDKECSPPTTICSGCSFGKMHRLPFNGVRTRATEIGELIHSDVCGPMQLASPTGSRYYVTFKDDFSGYRVIYFMKFKSEVFDRFQAFVCKIRSETKAFVRTLRTDGGGEFTSNEFEAWLTKKAIRHETCPAHTPQLNSVSERDHRTIGEAERSSMHMMSVPLELWAESYNCATYTLNRTLSRTSTATPYELWFKRKPHLGHLRIFGSIAYIHIPDCDRRKLDSKSVRCMFVGYCDTTKAYRFWDAAVRRIKISRDAIFDELNPEPFNEPIMTDSSVSTPSVDPDCAQPQDVPDPITSTHHDAAIEILPPTTNSVTTIHPRRSTREPQPKRSWAEAASHDSNLTIDDQSEPESYSDAIAGPNALLWNKAMSEEYKSLIDNKTWSLTTLPPGRSAIGCKWTFKIKRGSDGSIDRYKARFVAKGFSQRPGLDYGETYAPVIKHESLRIILSIAADRDLTMTQLDVKTAFLHGDVTEELYIRQPEGFVAAKQDHLVCKLHKGLYGLKQSSRLWNAKFNAFIVKFGLASTIADPCVYTRTNADELILLGIWVDDGLLCSTSASLNASIITYLLQHFEITSHPADCFIGLQIQRNRNKRELLLSQPQYIINTLRRFQMSSCHPISTPADPHSHLSALMSPITPETAALMAGTPYKEAIGSLIYLTTCSRPDIAYAVGQAARFCQNPGKAHWAAVKRILSYLSGTRHHGLLFSGTGRAKFVGYTDADYAGCIDSRRSTSGFIFLHLGCAVAWGSRRQQCTALSTTEAEYIAASDASKEAIWLRRLLIQIDFLPSGPVRLLCDNESAIRLVHNPTHHQRTKHIDVRFHFIREKQANGEIDINYVTTTHQLADILTKPLAAPQFSFLRSRIGIAASVSEE